MAFWNKLREPDKIEEIDGYPNIKNHIFFDADKMHDLNLFSEVAALIAREFTKVRTTPDENLPNSRRLDYILNLKPGPNQTANQLLYTFAFGLLKAGRVYYKVNKTAAGVMGFRVERQPFAGSSTFDYPQLKLKTPTGLLAQYGDLLGNLATGDGTTALQISSQIKAHDEQFQEKAENRLRLVQSQIAKYGAFFTMPTEEAHQIQQVRNPQASALKDLKALIYEHFNLNEAMMSGQFTESEYRAFYQSHIVPLAGALEELINMSMVDYNDWLNGARVSVGADLLAVSSLADLSAYADKALYQGRATADEVRKILGQKPLGPGLGDIVYTNRNSAAINNQAVNDILNGGLNNGTVQRDNERDTGDSNGEE